MDTIKRWIKTIDVRLLHELIWEKLGYNYLGHAKKHIVVMQATKDYSKYEKPYYFNGLMSFVCSCDRKSNSFLKCVISRVS